MHKVMNNLNDDLAVLYALLHDVGKPIRRYLIRYMEGTEESIEDQYLELVRRLGIDGRNVLNHEVISDRVWSYILGKAVEPKVKETLTSLLKNVDPLAALERGIEVIKGYKDVAKELHKLHNEVLREILGSDFRYDSNHTPLLSPLWILELINYKGSVGPCSKEVDFIKELKESLFMKSLKSLINNDIKGYLSHIRKMLNSLKVFKLRLWFPLRPLSRELIMHLSTLDYKESYHNVKYGEVVKDFLSGINIIRKIYTGGGNLPLRISSGLLDTLLNLMKRSFLLVPAAVYGSVLPDSSLYAHSKFVAALMHASLLSDGFKCRLLNIDINGIQKFVSSVVNVSAASKILRGRSLLVELIQDAVVRYVLKLFGNLSEANVLTNEGGLVSILVPDTPDFSRRLDTLKNVLIITSLEEFKGELGFTIAKSHTFSRNLHGYFTSLISKEGTFGEVLDSLSKDLAVSKVVRNSELLKYLIGEKEGLDPYLIVKADNVVGFDSSSKLSVSKDDKLRLCYDRTSSKYFETLAPGKFSFGDCLDSLSHRALVLGHVARNLVGIISLHVFKKENMSILKPADDFIDNITNELRKVLGRGAGIDVMGKELLYIIRLSKVFEGRISIGLIPLARLGSLYVLVSVSEKVGHDANSWGKYWGLIAYLLEEIITSCISSIEELGSDDYVIDVRVRIINAPEYFLPLGNFANESIMRSMKTIWMKGKERIIDLGFSFAFLNTYHPVIEDGGITKFIDLEDFKLLAIAKIDGDRLGDVKRVFSISPSRLILLSELLNIAFGAKTHLLLTSKLFKGTVGGNAIILYGGGDDVVIYGNWIDVLEAVYTVFSEVINDLLLPLSASAGIVIERVKIPILELYDEVVNKYLEGIAKEVRNSIALSFNVARRVLCRDDVINVIPPSSTAWSWNETWGFDSLIKAVKSVSTSFVTHQAITKRLLYTLCTLANEAVNILEEEGITQSNLLRKAKILISYAKLWEYRGNEMSKLTKYLQEITGNKLPKYPDPESRITGDDVINELAKSAPILNTILLILRLG